MMKNKSPYPKHIYEQIRVEIALVYLKREMRKMLSDIRGKELWQKIDSQIEKWFISDNQVAVRDFWNGFHGIAMGFKLKVSLIQALTAENVEWHLEKELPLDNQLACGGDLKYISEKLSDRRPRAFQLKEFFQKSENQKLAQYWQEEFAKHAQASEPRDSFPIIAMEEEDKGRKIFSIYDGNRRLVLAVLQGKTTISAYVGEYRTSKKTPQNFWLPTSFLMEFVKGAELMQTKENYPHILSTLQGLIKLSESGGYELKERVLIGKNEFRMRLKNDLGWS